MRIPDGIDKPCCNPPRGASAPKVAPLQVGHSRRVVENAVHIPGGQALVGTNAPQIPDDGESPLRKVRYDPFIGIA